MSGGHRRPLPDWLHNLILPALMLAVVAVFATVAAGAVVAFGLAWGLLIALALAVVVEMLIRRFNDDWGMLFAVFAVPSWVGIVAGLIGGLLWRIAI